MDCKYSDNILYIIAHLWAVCFKVRVFWPCGERLKGLSLLFVYMLPSVLLSLDSRLLLLSLGKALPCLYTIYMYARVRCAGCTRGVLGKLHGV